MKKIFLLIVLLSVFSRSQALNENDVLKAKCLMYSALGAYGSYQLADDFLASPTKCCKWEKRFKRFSSWVGVDDTDFSEALFQYAAIPVITIFNVAFSVGGFYGAYKTFPQIK